MKVCFSCKESHHESFFQKRLRNKDGLDSRCKKCRSDWKREYFLKNPKYREYLKERSRKNYRERTEECRAAGKSLHLKRKYGLSKEEYDRMSSGGCYICGSKNTGRRYSLAVDHCHNTGRVRGVLCPRCNAGVGFYETWLKEVGETSVKKYLSGVEGA